jgi:N-methylhydantoinase A
MNVAESTVSLAAKKPLRRLRIGIDVGGTFTHAVAIDTATFQLVGRAMVPTTHTHARGVAQGIIDSLYKLLREAEIAAAEVVLIAHSTTQATNALLEGDVAPVGIIGMGGGIERGKARTETRIGDIELAPSRFLRTFHRFIDTTQGLKRDEVEAAIGALRQEGAEVIVASEAFGVDKPQNEDAVVEVCRERGVLATNCYEISQLYGLRVRTRTAVINASMLPKMMETANMTEESVRAAGIKAPLMIMRSDGGIMDIEQMRRRPILTMLSGPAAGVAAALMYARITDGIFLEVGGTSTDISAIRNGKSLVKTATVGGHRLFLRTLDVRTIGLAGGSIPRVKQKRIVDVGPRSAHIAGLGYAAFTDIPPGAPLRMSLIQPKAGDPDDYVMLESKGKKFAVTPTCAANLLGLVPKGDHAEGNSESVKAAFDVLGRELGTNAEHAARQLLEKAYPKAMKVVEELIEDYELDRNLLTLSGGGGGAPALVPYTAHKMNLPFEIAPNAPVISAIGAALAMVRDMIERTVVDPSDADVLRIRKDAEEAVVRMGANPETVEVEIEVDPQKNILRAVATGSTELRTRDLSRGELPPQELEAKVRQSVREPIKALERIAEIGTLLIYRVQTIQKRFLGLARSERQQLRVIDKEGIIRLQIGKGDFAVAKKSEVISNLRALIERNTDYGDAGRAMPAVFVIFRGRILDLSGLVNVDQIISLLGIELARVSDDEPIAALLRPA